jgi:hypothetical protein
MPSLKTLSKLTAIGTWFPTLTANEYQGIECSLEAVCRGVFQGVFSANTLLQQPRPLVCNTDESTKLGQHWIAIYVDTNGRGEYFDSFGREPDKHLEAYI